MQAALETMKYIDPLADGYTVFREWEIVGLYVNRAGGLSWAKADANKRALTGVLAGNASKYGVLEYLLKKQGNSEAW